MSSIPFDPFNQTVTLLMADGVTPFNVTVTEINSDWFLYCVKIDLVYGSQIGACIVMFFVTVFLTRDSQRGKPVYILNIASLILGILRALLLCLWAVGPYAEFYSFFTGDQTNIHKSTIATSIAATVIPVMMTLTVNASLVIQAYTVVQAIEKRLKYLISIMAVLVLVLAVGFRFVECVTNSRVIMNYQLFFDYSWVQRGTLITETGSIWFFSLIFIGKLAWALAARKKMGFASWSPMEILVIMGGCTMIIPSIFAGLEYLNPKKFPEAGTLALTTVALLLPLSSLWASMRVTEQNSSFNISHLIRSGSSQVSVSGGKTFTSQSTSQAMSERKGSTAPINHTINESTINIEHVPAAMKNRDSTEMECEMLGVRVDRSYSIHSSRGGPGTARIL